MSCNEPEGHVHREIDAPFRWMGDAVQAHRHGRLGIFVRKLISHSRLSADDQAAIASPTSPPPPSAFANTPSGRGATSRSARSSRIRSASGRSGHRVPRKQRLDRSAERETVRDEASIGLDRRKRPDGIVEQSML